VPPPGYQPGYYPPPPGYRPVPPPALSPGGQPLASFGDRLLAYLLDGVIFTVVTMVIALPAVLIYVFAVMVPEIEADPYADSDTEAFKFLVPFLLLEAGIILVSLVLAYVYYVELMLRAGGQTVGKRVMKIRVIPIDPARTLD